MKRHSLCVCVFVLFFTYQCKGQTTGLVWSEEIVAGGVTLKVAIKADQGKDYFYASLSAATQGWIALGIGEQSSGSMPGADVVVAYIDSTGKAVALDKYCVENYPLDDTVSQDWEALWGQVDTTGGRTTIEVRRKMEVSFGEDRSLARGQVARILLAQGLSKPSGTSITKHRNTDRGLAAMRIPATENEKALNPTTNPTLLPDPNVMEQTYTFSNFVVPAKPTTYACQTWKLPAVNRAHIIKLEPLPNSDYVHHFQVFYCPEGDWAKKYATGPQDCSDASVIGMPKHPCKQLIWAWAKGGGAFVLPPAAGYLFGTSTSDVYIGIETHFDNPSSLVGKTDASGIKMFYTETLRPNTAGWMWVGDPALALPALPAQKEYVSTELHCPGTCTQKLFKENVTVFSEMLHMHNVGRSIWSTIRRSNGLIEEMGRVDFWAPGNQHTNTVSKIIQPGDAIHLTCNWNTMSSGNAVQIGFGTHDEMCMTGIAYYPIQQTGNDPVGMCYMFDVKQAEQRLTNNVVVAACGGYGVDLPDELAKNAQGGLISSNPPPIRNPPGCHTRRFGLKDTLPAPACGNPLNTQMFSSTTQQQLNIEIARTNVDINALLAGLAPTTAQPTTPPAPSSTTPTAAPTPTTTASIPAALVWQPVIKLGNMTMTYGVYRVAQEDWFYLKLEQRTVGWLGFGIAEDSSGGMAGADMLITWVGANGVTQVSDRYSYRHGEPTIDQGADNQNWQAISGSEANQITTVTVQRKLSVSSGQDRALKRGQVQRVLLASGNFDPAPTVQIHTFRAMTTIEIPLDDKTIVDNTDNEKIAVSGSGVQTQDFTVSNIDVGSGVTEPACQSFMLPNVAQAHIVGFEPMVNSNTLQTMIVYLCKTTTAVQGMQAGMAKCQSPMKTADGDCTEAIWAWAKGSSGVAVPNEAGYLFGTAAGTKKWMLLEMRYVNGAAATKDNSGVRIHYTTQLRANQAGFFFAGDPLQVLPPIPPANAYFTSELHCSAPCTTKMLPATGITVFSELFNMFTAGKSVWSTVHRKDGSIVPTENRVDWFGHETQRILDATYRLERGDSYHLTCNWDTSSKTVAVNIGAGAEICMSGVGYYPKQMVPGSTTDEVFGMCYVYQDGWLDGLLALVDSAALVVQKVNWSGDTVKLTNSSTIVGCGGFGFKDSDIKVAANGSVVREATNPPTKRDPRGCHTRPFGAQAVLASPVCSRPWNSSGFTPTEAQAFQAGWPDPTTTTPGSTSPSSAPSGPPTTPSSPADDDNRDWVIIVVFSIVGFLTLLVIIFVIYKCTQKKKKPKKQPSPLPPNGQQQGYQNPMENPGAGYNTGNGPRGQPQGPPGGAGVPPQGGQQYGAGGGGGEYGDPSYQNQPYYDNNYQQPQQQQQYGATQQDYGNYGTEAYGNTAEYYDSNQYNTNYNQQYDNTQQQYDNNAYSNNDYQGGYQDYNNNGGYDQQGYGAGYDQYGTDYQGYGGNYGGGGYNDSAYPQY